MKNYEPKSKLAVKDCIQNGTPIRDMCDLSVSCFMDLCCTMCPMTNEASRQASQRLLKEGYCPDKALEEMNLLLLMGEV